MQGCSNWICIFSFLRLLIVNKTGGAARPSCATCSRRKNVSLWINELLISDEYVCVIFHAPAAVLIVFARLFNENIVLGWMYINSALLHRQLDANFKQNFSKDNNIYLWVHETKLNNYIFFYFQDARFLSAISSPKLNQLIIKLHK